MTSWNRQDLTAVGEAEELQIAPVRRDGTLRQPTPIWVVAHNGDLYVRAAYGPRSRWYQATRACREGHIRAGGVDQDVTFIDVDPGDPVNDHIDAVYRGKYGRYGATYVDMMLAPTARATTLKFTPR
jgi:hypothetical protein